MKSRRRAWLLAAPVLAVFLAGCAAERLSPTAPGEIPADARAIAIRLRVDVATLAVQLVQQPTPPGVVNSVVGNDGVTLVTSNVVRIPMGKANKALVRFDVMIRNTLSNVALVAPTFPRTPSGDIVLFPFEATKAVEPSTDWDGGPFPFFSSKPCNSSTLNGHCFRWEPYASPIEPGTTSGARTVGFEVPNDVTTFEVLMLVAADLANRAPPPPPPDVPALALSSNSVSFTSTDGVLSPAVVGIVVSNSGTGTVGGLTAAVSYPSGQPAFLTAELSSATAPSLLTLTPSAAGLADGTYSATVTIGAADGVANSPQTVAVTFVVTTTPDAPTIALSANTASFSSLDGAVSPAAIGIAVTNAGTGTLGGLSASVTYAAGQPAFLTAALSGTNAPSLLTLTASAAGLADGTYNATVSVASPVAGNSPQTVEVTFVVTSTPDAPVLALSSTAAVFTSNDGVVTPGAVGIMVSNSGTGTLSGLTATVSYPAGQAAFLTTELSSTTAPSLLTLTPSAAGLADGTYSATVSIAAAGAGSSPQSITVTFVITSAPDAPALALSSNTASFANNDGVASPAAIGIAVTNSGTGTLSGLSATTTFNGTAFPLTVTLSSTTAPASLTLVPSPGVPDGTYSATVSVAAEGVANSPQTVAVTFVVTGSIYANEIYVSNTDPSALDISSCGLFPFPTNGLVPCRSITRGNLRALQTGRMKVRVADGRYTEAVNIIAGVELRGGYDPTTWRRHLSTTATIIDGVSSQGNHDRTVIANNIPLPTLFEGFIVRGAANTKVGGNSYAMYITATGGTNLVVRRNVFYAGSGGPGSDGVAGVGAIPGADGLGRDPANPDAYDAKVATGTGACDASNNRSYTNGGVRSYNGDGVGGGDGGGNRCPPSASNPSGLPGAAGLDGNGPGGAGGVPSQAAVDAELRLNNGVEVCALVNAGVRDGGPGGPGAPGFAGAPGAGGANPLGQISSSHWVGADGTPGEAGTNGGGGAGGAGGGGALCVNCTGGKDRLGGHGGGGGSGGGGGGAGGFGTAGGGAFGIFILNSTPIVTENTIVGGLGGRGGAGGTGATGSAGGRGGNGGQSSVFCTGAGGRGGDGGAGGHGSGGGGGTGGSSFGIFAQGAGVAPTYCTTSNNSISGGVGGSGGAGGLSLGNPGGSGVAGAVRPCEVR